jgi:hypothetical protein
MHKTLAVMFVILCIATPVYAQRDRQEAGASDRLDRREVDWQPSTTTRLFTLIQTPPTTNPYAKFALTDVDGDISPSATLGLNHKEAQHPWFAEAGYKYGAGDNPHHNIFSASGNYQFFTGSSALSPLLQFEVDYANRISSSQRLDAYFVGEITREFPKIMSALSLDAIAGFAATKPEGDHRTSDFAPGLSAVYSFPNNDLLIVDYVFYNKVDEEDSFDVGFRHKLPRGYAVDLVVFKHGDVRIRIRKDLKAFKPTALR